MPYFYIYKVTNPQTGEYYIGSRKSQNKPEDDTNYKGSMITWKVDKSLLVKEILEYGFENIESLRESESSLIKECIKDPLNKNNHIPNKGFYLKEHTEESKEKMRGRIVSEETKEKLKNRIVSEETKEKLRLAWKSRKPITEETRLKMSEAKRNMSEETKRKISDSHIGVNRTEETKKKISETRLNMSSEQKSKAYVSRKGMTYKKSDKPRKKKGPLSEEHKDKISKTLKVTKNSKNENVETSNS